MAMGTRETILLHLASLASQFGLILLIKQSHMPSSSMDDPGVESTPSASELHNGKPGKWVLVQPADLPRVPIEATSASPEILDPSAEVVGANPSISPPIAEKPKLELKRRQQLEHHLRSNPSDLDGFLELARIYRAENKPIEARRVMQQAIQIFPDEPGILWELEEATLSRSIQQLREVSDLAHRLNTAETDRELSRCQQDWAMRRIEVCQARIARDPSLDHLRVTLAEAKYDAGKYDEALEGLEPLLDIDEYSPAAYLIRGRCLLALGNDLDAMVALRVCALRRAVVAPLRTRVIALRLLCDAAERMGVTLTLANYRGHLQQIEQELAKQSAPGV